MTKPFSMLEKDFDLRHCAGKVSNNATTVKHGFEQGE
jgi:hypothetical protein